MYISLRQKIAGKTEAKKVTGLNFEEIRRKLFSSEVNLSKDQVNKIKEMLLVDENKIISDEKKNLILSLSFQADARKRINEIESSVIIIGASINSDSNEDAREEISLFETYLERSEASPGSFNLSESDISSYKAILSAYEKILEIVEDEKNKADEALREANLKKYKSDEVVYNFDDGWKVVYVPAAGEVEEFPGLEGTSFDRILEGNKNGLCLGSTMKYYQTNKSGRIYSVRDPNNEPKVTIRIFDKKLEEAKGKFNNTPDIISSKHALDWLSKIDGLVYKENKDIVNFPPLTIEAALDRFSKNPSESFEKTWVSEWFGKGYDIFDEKIIKIVKNKAESVLYDDLKFDELYKVFKNYYIPFARKIPEIVDPIASNFIEKIIEEKKYIDENAFGIDYKIISFNLKKEFMQKFCFYYFKGYLNLFFKNKIYKIPGIFNTKEFEEYFLSENCPEHWLKRVFMETDFAQYLKKTSYFKKIMERLSDNINLENLVYFSNSGFIDKDFSLKIIKNLINKNPRSFITYFLKNKNKSIIPYINYILDNISKINYWQIYPLESIKDFYESNLFETERDLIDNYIDKLVNIYLVDGTLTHNSLRFLKFFENYDFDGINKHKKRAADNILNSIKSNYMSNIIRPDFINNKFLLEEGYVDSALKRTAELDPIFYLNSLNELKEKYKENNSINLLVKNEAVAVENLQNLILRDPFFCLYSSIFRENKYFYENGYLDEVMKISSDKEPMTFIYNHKLLKDMPNSRKYLVYAIEKILISGQNYNIKYIEEESTLESYLQEAKKNLSFVNDEVISKEAKTIRLINLFDNISPKKEGTKISGKLNKYKKLSLALRGLGLKSEASTIENLLGIPLYHGTDETFSLGKWKISKSGALGAGIYLTPSRERAKSYGRNVIRAHASLEKPIIVDVGLAEGVDADPCIAALKALGVSEKAAISRVEKAYDERGYVSTGIKAVGEKLGYDGIMLYNKGELKEVVVWNAARISGAEIE